MGIRNRMFVADAVNASGLDGPMMFATKAEAEDYFGREFGGPYHVYIRVGVPRDGSSTATGWQCIAPARFGVPAGVRTIRELGLTLGDAICLAYGDVPSRADYLRSRGIEWIHLDGEWSIP